MDHPDARFYADLQREDDVGLVLRGHLHVEHQLIALISAMQQQPERCEWGRVPFAAKLEVASGCGLEADIKELLKSLGKLRNAYAHRVDASLDGAAVLGIYNSLSSRLREGLRGGYKAMTGRSLDSPSQVPVHDLLVMIFLNARQATKANADFLRRAAS